MADYLITSTGQLDPEEMLKTINELKDLFNIDFVSDADNILLTKKICYVIYTKVLELERRIIEIEGRR